MFGLAGLPRCSVHRTIPDPCNSPFILLSHFGSGYDRCDGWFMSWKVQKLLALQGRARRHGAGPADTGITCNSPPSLATRLPFVPCLKINQTARDKARSGGLGSLRMPSSAPDPLRDVDDWSIGRSSPPQVASHRQGCHSITDRFIAEATYIELTSAIP